ncbi:tol-pal system protein YbgF [Dokdonella fugitiva]|jgi:tol-pal system protein YbgF|uniref:Cell division coordinator CpoB n=1 Tax=Dokdonella fugitiva TaxID=328517 RepID=A0A4R2IEJ2_9GAMM|nr:tol-pal system protein YbgF [Dokdonella fugitiva]TCO42602.1 tol-pal system protein YbgF [Dokdonella fugitiva]
MAHLKSSAIATAALSAAVFAFAAPVSAQQRLSLAERVERLEQQANGQGSGAVDLVNQIQALQSQVQSLQGQVEELKHALDEAKQRNRDQYTDLDSRIARLEGRGATPAAAPAGARPAAPEQPPEIDLANPGGHAPAPGGAGRANVGELTADDRAAIAPGDAAPVEPPATSLAKAAPADPAAEGSTYNEAFAALKDGRYAESARRFQAFIDQYPNSDLTGNAYYWLGESYYVTQNYKIAEEAFQTLLARYPNSQKAPDALLKVGYSQYEQKQWDQAEATLNDVVQKYPDTTVARLAQGRLRALQSEARH